VAVAELFERLGVELRECAEPRRWPADDGEHEAETIPSGAHHRFGAAADAEPNRERL
jgi:hypothetical protein